MKTAVLAVAVYVTLNLAVALFYALDKYRAVEGKRRIRESTLLALGFVGSWGAVAGMRVFHHKTKKQKFVLNYLFLLLHAAVAVTLLYWLYG